MAQQTTCYQCDSRLYGVPFMVGTQGYCDTCAAQFTCDACGADLDSGEAVENDDDGYFCEACAVPDREDDTDAENTATTLVYTYPQRTAPQIANGTIVTGLYFGTPYTGRLVSSRPSTAPGSLSYWYHVDLIQPIVVLNDERTAIAVQLPNFERCTVWDSTAH